MRFEKDFNKFVFIVLINNQYKDFLEEFQSVSLLTLKSQFIEDSIFSEKLSDFGRDYQDQTGFALFSYRLAHQILSLGGDLSLKVARRISEFARVKTGVEIHPAAKIESPVFFEEGAGTIIGEQSIIGKRCIIEKEVILGASYVGKSKVSGEKRHPSLGRDIIVERGAMVLGDVEIKNSEIIRNNSMPIKTNQRIKDEYSHAKVK